MRDPSLDQDSTANPEANVVYDSGLLYLNRESRRDGIRGSRAHIGRMPGRRKAPPSLATHLGVPTPTGVARIWHPDYLQRLEDARADAVPDDGEGLRR